MIEMDAIDRRILELLQENARLANAEIARRVGMAPSAVLERVRKLEERGVIEGYEARLGARTLGLGLVAFIFVRTEDTPGQPSTGEWLKRIPEVQEIHHVAGEDCLLLKVRTADTEALGRLLRDRIGAVSTVRSTRTTIVLGTLKDTSRVPLPGAEMEAEEGAALEVGA
ncbi:MAG TPA: Lrp/AsnC family transcriptional regulator [Longimicrobiales bacterium]|nr:Lrp/AsnC family transcriptional regulator [Longimicrobiales bacterium]